MGEFILYMAKASVCLLFFSIFFRLLMLKETFFRFNRATLFIGLVVCSVLPTIKIQTSNALGFQRPIAQLEKVLVSYEYMKVSPISDASVPVQDGSPISSDAEKEEIIAEKRVFPLFTTVFGIYLLGVAFMLVRLSVSIFRLRQLMRKSRVVTYKGNEIVVADEEIVPFSFFWKIVISNTDFNTNPDEIILHEQMHIKYKHSLDILVSELFLAFHWFNPAVWSLSRDLREIHEYQADNGVLEHGVNPQKYQLLLVKKAVGEKQFGAITNGFNYSKIRNRIQMMLRKDSIEWARLKVLVALPFFGLVLLSFSQPVAEQQNELRYDDGEIIRSEEFKDSYSLIENRYTDKSIIVFLNSENELLFMTRHSDMASIKAFPLNNVSESVQDLGSVILNQIERSKIRSVDFILIAPENAYMEIITRIKNVMMQAYESALVQFSKEGKTVSEANLPLTIKYTMHRYQPDGEMDIVERLMQVVE